MTWSIIARDAETERLGVAVASRFFAVGARIPYIRTGVGAVATQALVHEKVGPQSLDLMASGKPPGDTLNILMNADQGRNHRQVHLMDNEGRSAAYTGTACIHWCGHYIGKGFSVAGNMLAGPQVIEATAEAYLASAHLPIARRLLAAMHAGEAAGGDKRGKQSAALLVHDENEFPIYDLRVDDHPDPLVELTRLHGVALERFVHFRRCMPNKVLPYGVTDREELERFITGSITENYE